MKTKGELKNQLAKNSKKLIQIISKKIHNMLKLYYVNYDMIKIKKHIIQFFVSFKFQLFVS